MSPSLQSLVTGTVNVIRRFPLSLFFAFIGTCAATALVEIGNIDQSAQNWCVRFVMISNLGLLLSLSVTLFSEFRRKGKLARYLLFSFAVLIPAVLLFTLNPLERENDFLRFFMIAAGFHLLVAFFPFLQTKHSIDAFWRFNEILFVRFLTGILYSGVLFLGLAAAIGSTNFLFNFDFQWDTFAILWIWIVGMFNTGFVLSGIPETIDDLEKDRPYPKGLKVFTQYVLIPLATVYVLILLVYELKILLEWNMPKGLVSSLILGYAVFGILSLLLVYPIRNLEENKWIKSYTRSFYFLMIPLIVLLILAIIARVSDYGVTEERYFLIVLAGWLIFITAYFLLSKKQNIILIPLSLCVVVLLSVYGPQSAFSVSRVSQLNELKAIFANYKAIKNGKLEKLKVKVDSADRARMENIVNYLVNDHGIESLQPLMKNDLAEVADSILAKVKTEKTWGRSYSRYSLREHQRNWVYAALAIPVSDFSRSQEGLLRRVNAENEELVPVADADYLIEMRWYQSDTSQIPVEPRRKLKYGFKADHLDLHLGKERLKVDLRPMLERVKQEMHKRETGKTEQQSSLSVEQAYFTVPRSYLTEKFVLNGYHVTLMFNELTFTESDSENSLQSANSILLLKKL